MDELKIKSSFMRGIVSRLLTSIIRQKLGYKLDIQINDILVTVTDDKAHIHIDADADMKIDEFKKITKLVDSR